MKIYQLLIFITLFSLLAPYLSFAQRVSPPESYGPPDIPTQLFSCLPTDSLRICILRLLGDVLRVILVIALTLAALFIAWAGVLYIYTGGAKDKLDSIKNRLIYAAVGLVVAFLSWVITVILAGIIGGSDI